MSISNFSSFFGARLAARENIVGTSADRNDLELAEHSPLPA